MAVAVNVSERVYVGWGEESGEGSRGGSTLEGAGGRHVARPTLHHCYKQHHTTPHLNTPQLPAHTITSHPQHTRTPVGHGLPVHSHAGWVLAVGLVYEGNRLFEQRAV